jgi:hypothetical protein
VLGHQFGQHLVFGLDLLLQELDPLLFGLMVRSALARKGRGAILEELFLPTTEFRWLQSQFIAEISKPALSGVVLSLFFSCVPSVILTEEPFSSSSSGRT